MTAPSDTERRKDRHLEICLSAPVDATGASTGLDAYRFDHEALPEIDLDEVDLRVELLGKRLAAPLIIGAMTGGTPRAARINRILAEAAEARGVGFALGSQRAVLERPEAFAHFEVRAYAPTALLFSNLGAVQLNLGVEPAAVADLVARTGADALNLHLNPLQEAIQPEGDTAFRGLAARIDALTQALETPVLLKEVGAGISPRTAAAIARLGVAGVEVAGAGGTSWARVESLRGGGSPRALAGEALAGWGVPTAASVVACRAALPDRLVIGSGGLRSGLDAAKVLALGADAVAMALPFLKAAEGGAEAVLHAIDAWVEELRVVAFCTGSRNVEALRHQAVLRHVGVGGRA